MSTAVFEVLRTGPQTLFQDRGRFGVLKMGVSPSGSFDRLSAARANHALGNSDNAPVLEILLGGLQLRALKDCVIIVTGVDCHVQVTNSAGATRNDYSNSIIDIHCGDTITLGHAEYGLRAYLAVRGGFEVPVILGSSSTDVLSSIGPHAPKAGDILYQGQHIGDLHWHPLLRRIPTLWNRTSQERLKVIMGPHCDWFSTETILDFLSQSFRVSPDSNRIGVRLEATTPILKKWDKELPSEGMVRGSIQIPPNGHPVVFGPDHPVTGGYPVIAVLTSRSCDRIAQLAPGQTLKFMPQPGT